jgi:hypothetical protein
MTEEEKRRCCILGGCGCSPGGAEQRAAMKSWLLEKLFMPDMPGKLYTRSDDTVVEELLNELFVDNPALTEPASEA